MKCLLTGQSLDKKANPPVFLECSSGKTSKSPPLVTGLIEENVSPNRHHCAAEKQLGFSNASLQDTNTVVAFFKVIIKN